jgi:1-acyl-sn-glycerol-3-phosphate acyltransferase
MAEARLLSMILRRLVTVPGYIGLAVVLTSLAPLLAVAAWILARTRRFRGALPTLGLLLGYLWCEVAGIVAAGFLWIRHRDRRRFLTGNYTLQCWWASTLKRIAERLFDLSFEVTGTDALDGPAAVMLPRHASIADTLIPMVFYAVPRRIRLRYVLKRELLLDPCLDIVGNRLPNYFVSRDGQDTERAVAGIAELARTLEDGEGLLFYPEGTRHSRARRARLKRRWRDQPDLLAQLERWPQLLPPRLGGTLALLEANPGRDLLFCAHTGFEGSSSFGSLINGAWIGATIRIHFWRTPCSAVPAQPAARREFLFSEWDRMNHWVSLKMQSAAGH